MFHSDKSEEREEWIKAIESIAEQLQVLDGRDHAMEEEPQQPKKKKVVRRFVFNWNVYKWFISHLWLGLYLSDCFVLFGSCFIVFLLFVDTRRLWVPESSGKRYIWKSDSVSRKIKSEFLRHQNPQKVSYHCQGGYILQPVVQSSQSNVTIFTLILHYHE